MNFFKREKTMATLVTKMIIVNVTGIGNDTGAAIGFYNQALGQMFMWAAYSGRKYINHTSWETNLSGGTKFTKNSQFVFLKIAGDTDLEGNDTYQHDYVVGE